MSKEMPASVEEISRVGEAAGQLGIQKKNILSFSIFFKLLQDHKAVNFAAFNFTFQY